MKEKNKLKTSKGLKPSKKKDTGTQAPPPENKDEKPKGRGRMNPDARKSVTASSSWTGKLPATLLYEHCQKMKWEKVVFDMVSCYCLYRSYIDPRIFFSGNENQS